MHLQIRNHGVKATSTWFRERRPFVSVLISVCKRRPGPQFISQAATRCVFVFVRAASAPPPIDSGGGQSARLNHWFNSSSLYLIPVDGVSGNKLRKALRRGISFAWSACLCFHQHFPRLNHLLASFFAGGARTDEGERGKGRETPPRRGKKQQLLFLLIRNPAAVVHRSVVIFSGATRTPGSFIPVADTKPIFFAKPSAQTF